MAELPTVPNVHTAAGRLEVATAEEAPAIAALRTAVAEDLTRKYGQGHWSSAVSERSVLHSIRTSRVLVLRAEGEVLATLRLATKKPWAIDTKYFTASKRPLYLTDMAVAPRIQRQGVGRRCVAEAREIVRAWPGDARDAGDAGDVEDAGDAIRLDAYDAAAGAGGFYARCGFREVGRVTYRHTPLIYFEMLLRDEE